MQLVKNNNETYLVQQCREDDRKAQQELYRIYSGKMFALSLRYAKNREDAQDILQTAFVRIFTKIDSYKQEGELGAWIRRIVVNTAIDYYRKTVGDYKVVELEEAEQISATAYDGLNEKEILQKIHLLPDGCRMILNLYAIEGYAHKEIANMLGINEGTSKSQLARARKLLQTMLLQDEQATGTYYR